MRSPDGSVADSIDLADPASYTETVGGATDAAGQLHEFNYYPVIITGDVADIYLHHELAYGQTYTVTIDPGVFTGYGQISWTFSTKRHPPRAGSRLLTVSASGAGDFCTVQGAIDFVPAGNTRPVLITVAPGTYTELDWVAPDKPHITVRGVSRSGTVIQYANNNTLNAASTTDICARQAIPVHDDYNCWRSNFSVEANDFTLENITLVNTTPYGGSQAEAFRGNADRITLNRVNLLSYQDTIRLQGLAYVTNSYIQGDVDFTWGTGTVFWTRSEFKSMHAGYVAQVRNPAGQNGYVFYDDTLTRAPSVPDGSVYLARIDPTVYPDSQVVYISTRMDSDINPAGWLLNNATCSAGAGLSFWEYDSSTLSGQPVDTSQRLSCSRQLTAAEATQWSDPGFVLGGWVPATVNATVTAGGAAAGGATAGGATAGGATAGGGSVAVDWSAPVGHSASDRLSLCLVHSGRCLMSHRVGTTATTGTASFALPAAPAGTARYEVRYYAANHLTATSASF